MNLRNFLSLPVVQTPAGPSLHSGVLPGPSLYSGVLPCVCSMLSEDQ